MWMEYFKKTNEDGIDMNSRGFAFFTTLFIFSKYYRYLIKYEIDKFYFSKHFHLVIVGFSIFFISKFLFVNSSREKVIRKRMNNLQRSKIVGSDDKQMKILNKIIQLRKSQKQTFEGKL
jgi:hypothetical protein